MWPKPGENQSSRGAAESGEVEREREKMVEDWRDTVSAMALEAQTEAENLMWVTRTTSDDDDDVEHASCSSGPSRPEQSSKRKQKAKAKRQNQRRGGLAQEKGGRVVKKYAVNYEGRRLQVCFSEKSPHAVTCSARAFVRSLLTFFC